MENLGYLVAVSLLFGTMIGLMIGWILWKKPEAKTKKLAVSDFVVCGVCRSPILDQPLRVVLTGTDAFRMFRCRQCGSDVTAQA